MMIIDHYDHQMHHLSRIYPQFSVYNYDRLLSLLF